MASTDLAAEVQRLAALAYDGLRIDPCWTDAAEAGAGESEQGEVDGRNTRTPDGYSVGNQGLQPAVGKTRSYAVLGRRADGLGLSASETGPVDRTPKCMPGLQDGVSVAVATGERAGGGGGIDPRRSVAQDQRSGVYGDDDPGPDGAGGRQDGSPGSWRAIAGHYFPACVLPELWQVDSCESSHGADPRTYDLDAANGGRLQLSRATWEQFFLETEGWTWEQIVMDDELNLRAAAVIWERAGRTWSPWTCKP